MKELYQTADRWVNLKDIEVEMDLCLNASMKNTFECKGANI